MKKLYLLFLLPFILSACSKDNGNLIYIRVKNDFNADIQNTRVFYWRTSSDDSVYYGKVKTNTISGYKGFDGTIAEYPLFHFEAAGEVYRIDLIRCGTGMQYLTPGKYTMYINGTNTNDCFVHFQKD